MAYYLSPKPAKTATRWMLAQWDGPLVQSGDVVETNGDLTRKHTGWGPQSIADYGNPYIYIYIPIMNHY